MMELILPVPRTPVHHHHHHYNSLFSPHPILILPQPPISSRLSILRLAIVHTPYSVLRPPSSVLVDQQLIFGLSGGCPWLDRHTAAVFGASWYAFAFIARPTFGRDHWPQPSLHQINLATFASSTATELSNTYNRSPSARR